MPQITLTNGGNAEVDPVDASQFEIYRWNQHNGYARRTDYSTGVRRTVYLHREITGAGPGDQVDHIDGDRLNCRRNNLRIVSASVNEYNKPATRRSSTGFRGVYERNGRYRAIVGNVGLGTHGTALEAYAAVLCELKRRAGTHAIPRA
jgi:hypothetical protein